MQDDKDIVINAINTREIIFMNMADYVDHAKL